MLNSTLRKSKLNRFLSFITTFCLLVSPLTLLAQSQPRGVYSNAVVDDILSKMSTREKIAQLFIVAFSSDPDNENTIEALNLVKKERVGGVIIMNSALTPGVEMINLLQSHSKIPLLVTLDGEWGASMRFDSVMAFPRQMQLGALKSDSLIYKMGYAIGEQTKRLGIDINYAPSIDINNNPTNPVINTRSFGEDRELVAKYGVAYMRGMQDAGVPGSAKHFPGHGDTDTDSHHALPLISFSKDRLDSLELYPFKKLIEAGVDMVMVAHLQIPSLDSSGRPSSISHPIVSDLLRRELEYNGLIITDALNMKGVSTFMAPEYLPLEAYKAGSDLILMPENVEKALDIMERAVKKSEISMHSLNIRAKKMLMLKMKIGTLLKREIVSTEKLYEHLNKEEYNSLITSISENSITLLENRENNLPIKNLKEQKIGYLSLGGDKHGKEFANSLLNYSFIDTVVLRGEYKKTEVQEALLEFERNNHTIIALHNTDARPQKEFGIDLEEMKLISDFAKSNKATLVYFGNPLAIPFLEGHKNFASLIVAYQNIIQNNIAAAHLIFGATAATGRLSVTAGEYSNGYSKQTEGGLRVRCGVPLALSYNYESLEKSINSIISNDIDRGNYSGAQLILINEKDIILNNSYGDITTEDRLPLNRIEGAMTLLPSAMLLREKGLLSLEEFDRDVLISDLIMHRHLPYGKVSGEPEFSADNNRRIKKVIEQRANSSVAQFVEEQLYSKLGIWNYHFENEHLYSNANEIAKLISLVFAKGQYGGEEIMSAKTADYISLFLQYHSSSPEGSLIWIDAQKRRALIFLNSGHKKSIDKNGGATTGDLLRRSFIDYLNQVQK